MANLVPLASWPQYMYNKFFYYTMLLALHRRLTWCHWVSTANAGWCFQRVMLRYSRDRV